MNNVVRHIQSYNELLQEERRLTLLLAAKRSELQADVQEIKHHFSPVIKVASLLKHVATPVTRNPLLGVGVAMGAGLLAEKAVAGLRPMQWLTKIVSPVLLKKAAGRLVQRFIIRKLPG